MSGTSDTWQTPPWIIERVTRIEPIALDPCAAKKVAQHFGECNIDEVADGLSVSWHPLVAPGALVYVNPPYSRGNLPAWTKKCADEAERGLQVVTLIPSRTGERWFAEQVWDRAQAACFLLGRIAFIDPETGEEASGTGRFSSVVVYYGAHRDRFLDAFEGAGMLCRLNAERNVRAA